MNDICLLYSLKGIEALEYWLDPESAASKSSSGSDPPGEGSGSSSSSSDTATAPPPPPDNSAELNQPKVFCQKGKCYPYDPARMKNQNLNLEMKPGYYIN